MIFSPSIRNLRYLSPCSVLANIFEFVGLAVIAYYIFGTPLPRFDTDHDGIGDDDNNVNKASPARTACPGSPQPASSQSSLAPLSLPLRFENLLIIISNFCDHSTASNSRRDHSVFFSKTYCVRNVRLLKMCKTCSICVRRGHKTWSHHLNCRTCCAYQKYKCN